MLLVAAAALVFALLFASEARKLEQDLKELDVMIDRLDEDRSDRESSR